MHERRNGATPRFERRSAGNRICSVNDDSQPRDSRLEADGFLKKLRELEVVILFETWDTFLERFQKTNLALQQSGFL